jgi:spermidine synthase
MQVDSKVVDFTLESLHNRLRVFDADGVRTLRFTRHQQTSMYLDDPFRTDIEYVGYLHLTVAVVPHTKRALVVGLGGGTLVKQLWRDHPRLTIDAVELDGQVVSVAREYFALPDDPRIRVIVGEGRTFIETSDAEYDIIVIDAFDDGAIPRPLTTEQFLRSCLARLAPDGVIAYNTIGAVAGSRSKAFRSLRRTIANIWRHVWVFTVDTGSVVEGGDGVENYIVLASDAALTDEELRARIRSRVDGTVSVPGFDGFGENLYLGPIRSGDAPILTDAPQRR